MFVSRHPLQRERTVLNTGNLFVPFSRIRARMIPGATVDSFTGFVFTVAEQIRTKKDSPLLHNLRIIRSFPCA
jgi:hypothetical protein